MRTLPFMLLMLILASLACNVPGSMPPDLALEIPTFTPTSANAEVKPTDLFVQPTATPEPTALQPQPNIFDPRSIADCDIFVDADFPNTIGAIPDTKQALSDMDKKACQYNFLSGTLFVSISTSLPGLEAYENVRQFDAMSGGSVTPYPIGEVAVLKDFGSGRLALEAVLNGWYVVLDVQGFDEKNLVLLAELLLTTLAPYSS